MVDVIKGQRDVGDNIVKYFPITDKDAEPRRQAVKVENCNVCHLKLATHGEGGARQEYCVMCHNAARRTETNAKSPTGRCRRKTIHYKRMIHRIHTGR